MTALLLTISLFTASFSRLEAYDWEDVESSKQAAEQGDAEGQWRLGVHYRDGDGVAQDYKEAAKWFRKAAEQGHAKAQSALGNCYYYGEGVEKDYAEAVKWYRKSAEQGYAVGQCNLGNSYYNGEGVEKDYAEAIKWYRKAAEPRNQGIFYSDAKGDTKDIKRMTAAGQEYAPAQCALGNCYYYGRGVEKDYAEAVKWYRKAAEQGLAEAQYELGLCYRDGEGVEKNYAETVKWYRKSAEQGYASAQCALGNCYYYGRGVEKDYAEAIKWYRKAAEQGQEKAQCALGNCYYHGRGVEKDYAEAVKWYRKSAEQGYAVGQCNLGNCYYYGRGVEKDYAEAVKLYRKSADQGYEKAIKILEELGEMTEDFTPLLELQESTQTTNQTTANASQSSGTKAGERLVKVINGVEFAFRWCPAGTFIMGSPTSESRHGDGEMQHRVTLTKGFWMMETEVTQKQWKAVMGSNPSYFKGDDLPVEAVSWKDCQKFCKKCAQLGFPVQLPTEAQWEYACRAGSTTAYFWGNALNGDKANCDGNYPCGTTTKGPYLEKTTPVGSYQPNSWGLYDMHGNVWEWCQDWDGDYPSGGVTDPTGPSSGSSRVYRGGSWSDGARNCRSAIRHNLAPGDRGNILGFRLVKGQ